MSEKLPVLDLENVSAYFDPEKNVSFVTYKGKIGSYTTKKFYDWVRELLKIIEAERTYAVIFDFRQVTEFDQGNLITVKRQSDSISRKEVQINHPVALIVESIYQEKMVKISMQLSKTETRQRVVYSMDEAWLFIKNWHAAREKKNQ